MYTKKIRVGYYGYESTAYYDKSLMYCPYGSAGVKIHGDGSIDLISYKTRVITIDPDGFMEVTGTYSATTRKHIAAFLREYAPAFRYQDAKELARTGDKINIYTGEVLRPQAA